MGLEWIQVSLRGHGGSEPIGTSFFEALGLENEDGFARTPGETSWKAAIISLLEVEMQQCLQAEEPSEEFAARVTRGLHRAAQWLSTLAPDKFLLACGRLGLSLTICTND